MPDLVYSEFPSRIRIGYVLREAKDYYSFLFREQVGDLDISLAQLHASALHNLQKLPSARITFADLPDGTEGFITAEDNFVAARILLPEVRARFTSKLGTEFCTIVPHRDDCFCWSRLQPAQRQERHAAQALEDFRQEDYSLTPDILLVDANGLRVSRVQERSATRGRGRGRIARYLSFSNVIGTLFRKRKHSCNRIFLLCPVATSRLSTNSTRILSRAALRAISHWNLPGPSLSLS